MPSECRASAELDSCKFIKSPFVYLKTVMYNLVHLLTPTSHSWEIMRAKLLRVFPISYEVREHRGEKCFLFLLVK